MQEADTESIQSTDANNTYPWYQPLCQVTPVSKYLAMVIFIVLPFVGGYVGYQLVPEQVIEITTTNYITDSSATTTANTISPTSTVINESFGILNNPDVTIFAVEESKIEGEGRSYSVMGLYKKVSGKEAVKFASVGKLQENPRYFAVSPDRKKVAVNLETRLIVIDTDTGSEETLYTPKFMVGGRIAFSPDGTKLAFIDGSQYETGPEPDYKYNYTLYIVDVQTKELKTLSQGSDFKYEHVNNWLSDTHLELSFTAAKGCAVPVIILLDTTTNITKEVPTSFVGDNQKNNLKVYSVSPIVSDLCQQLLKGEMCGDRGEYTYREKMKFTTSAAGETLGEIGEVGKIVDVVRVAPDSDVVLYRLRELPTDLLQCKKPKLIGYFIKNFTTGEIQEVSDLGGVLEKWGVTLTTSDAKIQVLTPEFSVKK